MQYRGTNARLDAPLWPSVSLPSMSTRIITKNGPCPVTKHLVIHSVLYCHLMEKMLVWDTAVSVTSSL